MKYKKYPSYKDSGVEWLGEIPSEWIGSTLKYHSYIYNGNSISDTEKEQHENLESTTSIPYISTKDIDSSFLTVNYDNGMRVSRAAEKFKKAKKDTTLLCIEGGSAGKKLAFLKEDVCFVNKLACIDSYNGLNRKFSHYITRSTIFKYSFNLATTGLIPGVSINQLKDFDILLPPLQEQQQIANFLDTATAKIDTLIAKQEKLIELLKEKRQAVISHAVTKGLDPDVKMKDSGVEWLGEVPEHWGVDPLRRSLIEHKQGFYTTESYNDDGVKLLRITDLQRSGLISYSKCPRVTIQENDKSFLLRNGDFVFARTGGAGSFGHVEHLEEDVVFASYLIRFRFSIHIIGGYLKYFFMSSSFINAIESNIHGGVNKNIHAEDIKNQFITKPSIIEQEAIANFLDNKTSKIDSLIYKATKSIELLKEKRTALISSAVTGKIDIRDVA